MAGRASLPIAMDIKLFADPASQCGRWVTINPLR